MRYIIRVIISMDLFKHSKDSSYLFNCCNAMDLFIKAWLLLGSIFNALSNSAIPSSFLSRVHNAVPFDIKEFK